ncbi:MAG TPA: SDR family oxidoreductase [Tepidisphaeraceae bacterium]|nr:SDR family oxidoreductase [Tepidisphaeraceae bacterium]
MANSLKDQVALVTGSGRGLGRAMAERLAESGANIAIHDISNEAPAEFGEAKDLNDVAGQIAAKYGVRTVAVTADIASEQQVRAMVEKIESALGPITRLVNNAGGDIAARGGKPKPNDALNIPMEDVRAIFDRNLVGTMVVTRAIVPGMIARQSGAVVFIGSDAAHMGCTDGVAYAVAKAGVVHFCRCLALTLRPHGVRANVISPGPTKTARFLVTRTIDQKLAEEGVSLDRYGNPREIANGVNFLCSDDAAFITGQVLRVDGGWLVTPL